MIQFELSLHHFAAIHRLDRLVSGLLIIARNAEKADFFRQQVLVKVGLIVLGYTIIPKMLLALVDQNDILSTYLDCFRLRVEW